VHLITSFVPTMAYCILVTLLAVIGVALIPTIWSLKWIVNSNISLPDNRDVMCTVLLDDSNLVAINGRTSGSFWNEALLFNINNGQWSNIAELTLCFVI